MTTPKREALSWDGLANVSLREYACVLVDHCACHPDLWSVFETARASFSEHDLYLIRLSTLGNEEAADRAKLRYQQADKRLWISGCEQHLEAASSQLHGSWAELLYLQPTQPHIQQVQALVRALSHLTKESSGQNRAAQLSMASLPKSGSFDQWDEVAPTAPQEGAPAPSTPISQTLQIRRQPHASPATDLNQRRLRLGLLFTSLTLLLAFLAILAFGSWHTNKQPPTTKNHRPRLQNPAQRTATGSPQKRTFTPKSRTP